MSRSATALDVAAPTRAFGDGAGFARAGQDGDRIYRPAREGTGTAFVNGMCKSLLTLAVLGLVAIGGVHAFNTLDLKSEAAPTVAASGDASHVREIDALRAEIALLTEQSLALRAELALLTGQGGVLPRLVARLRDQRKVNGVHSNAIRQLYATTGLIGASQPSNDDAATADSAGARPVQVTPVAGATQDAPQRVVLIPDPDAEATSTTGAGNGGGGG